MLESRGAVKETEITACDRSAVGVMDQGILMTVKSIFKRESVSEKCIRWIICVPFFPRQTFFLRFMK